MPSHHWHPTNQHAQQLQLKCLVLGSAGAGKTSLLRRFNYGTFEGHDDEQFTRNTMTTATNNWRSGRRNPTSTLGADYYVKKTANPLFDKERSAQHCYSNSRDDAKNNTPSSRVATSTITAAESHSQLFVQLWDTAGKERLMPQRYPAQYDKKSNFYQFLSIRLSKTNDNNNSNNYEHRYNNWGLILKGGGTTNANDETSMHNHPVHEQREKLSRHNNNINNNTQLKHGRPLHYHHHNSKKHYSNEPIEDALYRNVDACMLVYDSTSSVSFLHLMQLHSEWVQRLNRWEREDEEIKNNCSTAQIHTPGRRRRKHIPFIVVANKIDLLEKSELLRSSSVRPERRSVMGFREGQSYKGKDFVYEFAVENAQPLPKHSSSPSKRRSNNNDRLTYSLKETSWSNDRIYLRALQLTEDQLPANRLLILLWCQRNGIPHFEASALDGRGVDDAMNHLIVVGVEELQRREEAEKLAAAMEHERVFDYEHSDDTISHAHLFNIEGTMCVASNGIDRVGARGEGECNKIAQQHNIVPGVSRYHEDGVAPPASVSSVDPSQYYFLYQPKQDEPLDLFARYSAKKKSVSSCFCKCC